MRSAAKRVSKEVDFPAPVGGWRTDVTLSDMPKDSAAVLDNFFPESTSVRARRGYMQFATGLGSTTVGTILAYNGSDLKLFASAGANIYDITDGGAVSAAVISGLAGDRWSYANFANPAGHWLVGVNGSDTPINFNGAAWGTATAITGTGLTASNLFRVITYRSRLWFLEKNTTKLWYLATSAVGGTANAIEIGSVMKRGGNLIALGVWSVPTYSGITECLCMMSDQGEVIIYQGSDPTTTTDWSLLGTFQIGRPVGDRPLFQVGGDLAIITQDAIVPISQVVKIDRGALLNVSLTKGIGPTWTDAVTSAGTYTGWELIAFPQSRMAIVNVPFPEGAKQFVMNTTTGAWCRFTNIPANTWAVWDDQLFFGGANGIVYKAETGSLDDVAPIDCLMVGAFNRFGTGLSQKQAKLITASLQLGAYTSAWLGVSVDYVTKLPTATGTANNTTVALWGVARWGVDVWAGNTSKRAIANANGVGIAFAPTIRMLIGGNNSYASAGTIIGGSMAFEVGGPV
ncbi:MAG TPA: hypothetical protein VN112_16250 [Ensifer sp.]|nr:hypothetical protein [Ensifer sp.]